MTTMLDGNNHDLGSLLETGKERARVTGGTAPSLLLPSFHGSRHLDLSRDGEPPLSCGYHLNTAAWLYA